MKEAPASESGSLWRWPCPHLDHRKKRKESRGRREAEEEEKEEEFLHWDEFLDNHSFLLMTFQVLGAAAPSGTRCRAVSQQLESATSLGSEGAELVGTTFCSGT